MKLTRIALAVAAVAATPVFAATGSLTALYGVPASNLVYVSGASALSGSLAAVVGTVCDGGSANVKVLTIGGSTSDGRVAVCTTKSPAGGQFAQPFAVVKRDTDGSFAGVGPVIAQTALTKWADVNSCDNVALSCALDSSTAIVPHAGLTDVDSKVWIGLRNTNALSQPVPTATGNTTFNGGFAGQGFGVMASEELYKAMQTVQINDGRLPGSCTVGDLTPGQCQPSIAKEEYAAIADDSGFNYVTSLLSGANNPLTGDMNPVNLCRRVETSGTQASSNVYFLANPCANTSPTLGFKNPRKADFAGGTAVAFDSSNGDKVTGNYDDLGGIFGVFEGSGTGDARNCVIRRNGGKNPNDVADALGTYAIGWISLENAPAAGWKLLKLDGVSPNAYQVVVGSAEDGAVVDGWAQDSTQRITTVRGLYDAAPELEMLWPKASGFKTFLEDLRDAFGNPVAVNTRGIFQANKPSLGFTHAAFPTQVHKGTRNGNFCAPQILAE
ncbi:MAG: hypothetical protein B7Z32_11915 [Hydrogenophilales bacterium 12-64-13]|nr:MAG: hypothetical protein B7Z32_11915 [Hydrogenophilales bacterium 12-64-13]